MMRRLIVLALAAGMLMTAAFSTKALAAPEPLPASRTWSFDLTHGKPTPIAVRSPSGKWVWYWFMTYKVVNNGSTERLFVPEVTVATDAGPINPSGKDVPLKVFEAIKEKLGNSLLESPDTIVGKLRLGEDAARESVVIWQAFPIDKDPTELNIFIAGLSGEAIQIDKPAPPEAASTASAPASAPASTDSAAAGDKIPLRKTLMITFHFPGTHVHPQEQPVVYKSEKWIMR